MLRREKDAIFTRVLFARGLMILDLLQALLEQTPVSSEVRDRIHSQMVRDFGASKDQQQP